MDGDDWFTLTELTERLGALVWVEEQLARLLQGWSAVEGHAPAAVHFATTGRHHEWHSEVVRDCLPTSPRLLEVEVVRAPTTGWESAVRTLASLTDPEATVARLRSLVKVLNPWIEREIFSLTDLARPVSDAAMMRWLRFVSIDHDDDGAVLADLLAVRASGPARFGDHAVVNDLDLS